MTKDFIHSRLGRRQQFSAAGGGDLSARSNHAVDTPHRPSLQFCDSVARPRVQEAVAAFDHAEGEALAVIDSQISRRVVGLLSEAHALRRYSSELERRQREFMGEV